MNGTSQQTINVNVNQVIAAFVVSMLIAATFVAFITNTIVNNKVSALTQMNPVTSTAAAQTNNAPDVCVGTATPQTAADGGVVLGNGHGLNAASFKGGLGGGSFSYSNNQTNISNTTNTSTNTAIDSRYSGNNISMYNGNTMDSGNSPVTTTTNTNNNTTNTTTNTVNDNSNQGNGNNSGNSSTSTSTNVSNTDNSNNSVNNSGNTTVGVDVDVIVL